MIPETEQQWQERRTAFRAHCRHLNEKDWAVVIAFARDYLLKCDPAMLLILMYDRAEHRQRSGGGEVGGGDEMAKLCRDHGVVLYDAQKAEDIELEEGDR